MAQNFDLFGDPIPDNWGLRGRPEHVATNENALKIKVLLADGWSNKRIASVLGITVPTLRKHYFSVLAERGVMRDRMIAAHRTKVFEKAMEGDNGALRLQWQMMRADEVERITTAAQKVDDKTGKPKAAKLGKKEQAILDAGEPDSDWGDILGDNGQGRAH